MQLDLDRMRRGVEELDNADLGIVVLLVYRQIVQMQIRETFLLDYQTWKALAGQVKHTRLLIFDQSDFFQAFESEIALKFICNL